MGGAISSNGTAAGAGPGKTRPSASAATLVILFNRTSMLIRIGRSFPSISALDRYGAATVTRKGTRRSWRSYGRLSGLGVSITHATLGGAGGKLVELRKERITDGDAFGNMQSERRAGWGGASWRSIAREGTAMPPRYYGSRHRASGAKPPGYLHHHLKKFWGMVKPTSKKNERRFLP
jgi:hypothetical protein